MYGIKITWFLCISELEICCNFHFNESLGFLLFAAISQIHIYSIGSQEGQNFFWQTSNVCPSLCKAASNTSQLVNMALTPWTCTNRLFRTKVRIFTRSIFHFWFVPCGFCWSLIWWRWNIACVFLGEVNSRHNQWWSMRNWFLWGFFTWSFFSFLSFCYSCRVLPQMMLIGGFSRTSPLLWLFLSVRLYSYL